MWVVELAKYLERGKVASTDSSSGSKTVERKELAEADSMAHSKETKQVHGMEM